MTTASFPASTPDMMATSRKFLIFGVMALGQFLALLDIQIVAASLNEVQAGLSAGPDEISWVQTAYLMAELVMIPFSGFLAQALGTRWTFALSAGLFTVSSALCGAAGSIESMIVFRAIQGFVGGAMIPIVFSTGFTLFTGKERAMIPAILGMVSVLAPTLGPTVGGWITELSGWRWIFYINVVPGIAVTLGALLLVRGIDRGQPQLLRRIDYAHLGAMATFLGGLEYVLEEGQRHDWLNDPGIAMASWLSFVACLLFLERSFRSGAPIVRLTPFRRPDFALACVFNLVIGFGLYSSTYLVPVFLGRVRGYNSLEIGTTVFVVGLSQIAGTLIAARLSQRIDPRYVIGPGLTIFAFSLWLTSAIGPEWGFGELLIPQLVRGLAIMLCIVPSVTMALSGFSPAELKGASGLFNLMRNLGGAIGIAVVNVWLYDATRTANARFGEALGAQQGPARDVMVQLTRRMGALTPDPAHALTMAQSTFGQVVGRQALTIGFDEVFRTMAWIFILALVLIPFCRPMPGGAAAASAAETH